MSVLMIIMTPRDWLQALRETIAEYERAGIVDTRSAMAAQGFAFAGFIRSWHCPACRAIETSVLPCLTDDERGRLARDHVCRS